MNSRANILALALVSLPDFTLAATRFEPEPKPNPAVLAELTVLGDNSCYLFENTRIVEDLGDFAKGWHRMKETGPAGRDFTIKMA